jgi:uncharacterized protein (UPF0332 family)
MTPETRNFLQKANRLLAEAEIMLGVGLLEAAGRTAYLAGFHAAQALIFERTGKVLKTHNGVRTEFLRLTKDEPRIDADLRAFLSQSYNLKTIADYDTSPESDVSPDRATAALDAGKHFVGHVETLIPAATHGGTSDPTSG